MHIANRAELDGIVDGVNDTAERLVASFWPGPLTIVFSSKDCVSKLVTCGKSTVAVRQPSHPVAKALIEAAQVPVAAPSANRSGRPSPTLAEVRPVPRVPPLVEGAHGFLVSQHVKEDLAGSIAGIVDGGATEDGLESTVCGTHAGLLA